MVAVLVVFGPQEYIHNGHLFPSDERFYHILQGWTNFSAEKQHLSNTTIVWIGSNLRPFGIFYFFPIEGLNVIHVRCHKKCAESKVATCDGRNPHCIIQSLPRIPLRFRCRDRNHFVGVFELKTPAIFYYDISR